MESARTAPHEEIQRPSIFGTCKAISAAFWNAGLVEDFSEDMGGERSDFGGLVNAGAARRKRGNNLDQGLVDRPVPWRDHADDAGWFAAHDRTTALGVFESIVLKASDPECPLRGSGLKAPRKKEGLREIDL
jgi:hypothetical protein